PALRITGDDVVSDNGAEVYSFLRRKGIHNLLVMGVHTNMCILKRSFAIRQMTNWGIHCVLVRDLTDTMYDPNDRPFVSHDQGTELVVEHIEKYWGPSILSADLVKALGVKQI
ncbi:MAG: isochorismatase family protein, partial [Acidobacteriota bacterium]|nr:isochorismatase family protein [Acidobacteriota bacterium]